MEKIERIGDAYIIDGIKYVPQPQEVKDIILTTEDGVIITEKDTKLFMLDILEFGMYKTDALTAVEDAETSICEDIRAFSTEAARYEYIVMNRPLTLTEILDELKPNPSDTERLKWFFSLFNQKIKNNTTQLAEILTEEIYSYNDSYPNVKFFVDEKSYYWVTKDNKFVWIDDHCDISDYINNEHILVEGKNPEGVNDIGVYWMNRDFGSPNHLNLFIDRIAQINAIRKDKTMW